MTDLGSVTALITAAGSVIGLANKANSVDANQKILDLQQRMVDVQQMTAELFEENQNLKKENRELRDEINGELMYPLRESARWKKSADGTSDDGPFCPICFGKEKLLMPLRFLSRTGQRSLHNFTCPQPHVESPASRREIMYIIRESSIKADRYFIPS